MLSAARITLVWLLALLVVPIGSGPLEREPSPEACAPWCPCEAAEREATAEHDETQSDDELPCDEDCSEDCSRCCDARTLLAVSLDELSSTTLRVVATRGLPPLETPGCHVATGVFRPPRSLT
ncbi:hypothetical protein ENSA5_50350 [Enhygromyxa salina]|uniref:Uncharacterized protein n=2 Tax=Enhygromyxa salina TaxID=215803 RepID=A0A2S9XH92_9BACT|nr:hypothetical protein ENSA5_50350 [Enhygromyxa salina]